MHDAVAIEHAGAPRTDELEHDHVDAADALAGGERGRDELTDAERHCAKIDR